MYLLTRWNPVEHITSYTTATTYPVDVIPENCQPVNSIGKRNRYPLYIGGYEGEESVDTKLANKNKHQTR